MNNQVNFTIRQRKSDRLKLRVGDAFTFPVKGSFGISIVSDFGDSFIGFTIMPKTNEVIFGDLSKNYSIFDKVIRTEYQYSNPKEINFFVNNIYKKLSLNISRKLFIETFIKSIFYSNDFQRESSVNKNIECVKKLPFITEGYDLNGLSIKELKKLRENLYSVIKGRQATKEDMKFLGFIKKAINFQRNPRAIKIKKVKKMLHKR